MLYLLNYGVCSLAPIYFLIHNFITMSQLKLEHVNFNELPPQWAKQLPQAQTVTVTIVVENLDQQVPAPEQVITEPSSSNKVPDDQEAYLQYLCSQGINVERLEESIKQLEVGESEIVKLDDLDNLLDEFIENAKIETHT